MLVPFSNCQPIPLLLHLHAVQERTYGGPAVTVEELGSVVSVAMTCSAAVHCGQEKQERAHLT